jgi:hypothetical protein
MPPASGPQQEKQEDIPVYKYPLLYDIEAKNYTPKANSRSVEVPPQFEITSYV